jgi:two-component system response regulator DesR
MPVRPRPAHLAALMPAHRLIRVLIAEEITLLRTGLVALLSAAPGIEVVAVVARGDQLAPVASCQRADVAIIDADLPGADGLTAAEQLHDVLPGCRALILADAHSPGLVSGGMAAHVLGLLRKDVSPALLVRAVRNAAAGKTVIDPGLAGAQGHAGGNPLTGRERDVLRLAAGGAPTAEIASGLGVTQGTVRNYLSRVIGKTGARNRLDAIRIATEAGWLLPMANEIPVHLRAGE